MAEKTFKINTDGFEKELAKIRRANDVYKSTKSELIECGFFDEDIYQYTFPAEPVELVEDEAEVFTVKLDGHPVGKIAKSNYAKVNRALKKADQVKVAMLGGKSKLVKLWYDRNDKERYDYLVSDARYIGTLRIIMEED